jgi:hypothetical protein
MKVYRRRLDSLACLIVLIGLGMIAGRVCAAAQLQTAMQLASADRAFETAASAPGKVVFTSDDEKLLDDLEQRSIAYFVECADPITGLMPDRAAADGPGKDVASIASVGFGLTALCIGDERGWIKHEDAYNRALRVLRFLREKAPQEHGHFYHFLNMRTGERTWNCEVSNIDTALLMAGVLTARQHFANTELATLANDLYERVDWPWMLTDNGMLSMGWIPEHGFIKARWDQYNEGPLIYLLGMGSRTHPLPAEAWRAWRRQPVVTYAGLSFLQCPPLFTHQYAQGWFDLRNQRDDYADYFRNSQLATLAQRQWCIDDLSKRFSTYGPDLWGISSSDGPRGYQSWGGPPAQGDIDGSIVPCAAAGSLPFEPRLCMDTLKKMRQDYGTNCYRKYGFVDAFNPATHWYNADVLGIDVGVSVVMAENARSGFVWKTFMSSEEAQRALKAAGFRALNGLDTAHLTTSSVFNELSSPQAADSRP